MSRLRKKQESLARRKLRVRRKISGTPERPRLSVFRSLKHIHAQIIDDTAGATLVAATSLEKGLVEGGTGNIAGAAVVGKALAERAVAQGVSKVVFDRSGRPFHGRVKALADAAREAGLDF
ncbi:MAG: 50S ribosomal protein L18 [Armatimonadetes bacterium]|nr:50S ribosomal protein L18 [Armatimonadota bacterium]